MGGFSNSACGWFRPACDARRPSACVSVPGNPTPARDWARRWRKLGPAYIKLGQMLATRPDIVGIEVAKALEHLQDRLPPFPENDGPRRWSLVHSGKPVEALFSSFGAALAAASIAQVHRAQTSDEVPVRVAVKILRPRNARSISCATWTRWLFSRAHAAALVGRGAAIAPHRLGCDAGGQRGAGTGFAHGGRGGLGTV